LYFTGCKLYYVGVAGNEAIEDIVTAGHQYSGR